MDPITIALLAGAGAQVASSIVQWFNSQEARNASQQEINKMQDLLAKVQDPNFDFQNINAEEFQVVGKLNPEVAQFVEEKMPETVKMQSQNAQFAKAGQREALQNLLNMSRDGQDPLAEIDRQRAARSASAAASSARASNDAQYARRGMLNSSMQYAADMSAGDEAAQRAALAGEQGVINRQQARMQATGQAGSLGGQMAGQEFDLERGNVGILNDFNRRLAGDKQQYLNNAANTRNMAQAANLAAEQRAADSNVGLRNGAVDKRNSLSQNVYENAMSKYRSQNGLSDANRQQIIGAGQDRNQAIQGVGDVFANIAGTYASSKMNQNAKDQSYDREKELQDRYVEKRYGQGALTRGG